LHDIRIGGDLLGQQVFAPMGIQLEGCQKGDDGLLGHLGADSFLGTGVHGTQ
jgi:hypothetical protein